jgi:hypothetical protein
VVASSIDSVALVAKSTRGNGVVASTDSITGTGVLGRADATGPAGFVPSTVGVLGTSRGGTGVLGSTATGLAGFFVGPVTVLGNVVVTGAKSAAVPHPDGSHRLTYAVESPESWFEDFGRDYLSDGRALVRLDPDFAAVVNGDYHVFLTPEGDCAGLFVSARAQDGFEVREQQGGRSSLPFSYRVAARRRDLRVQRLQPVELPPPPEVADVSPRTLPPPEVAELPQAPAAPRRPPRAQPPRPPLRPSSP